MTDPDKIADAIASLRAPLYTIAFFIYFSGMLSMCSK